MRKRSSRREFLGRTAALLGTAACGLDNLTKSSGGGQDPRAPGNIWNPWDTGVAGETGETGTGGGTDTGDTHDTHDTHDTGEPKDTEDTEETEETEPDTDTGSGGPPRVVIVKTTATIDADHPPSVDLMTEMIEAGILALSGLTDLDAAWDTFVSSSDRVVTPYSGSILHNVPELNVALYQLLQDRGVKNLLIGAHRPPAEWLEAVEDMMGSSMPDLIEGPDSGEDIFGIAYESMDLLLPMPTLKRHKRAGVSGLIKLYAAFSRSGPSVYHDDGMIAAGAAIRDDFPSVRKLHIVDLIRVGTEAEVDNVSPESGYVYTKCLVFGTDPVATDRVAVDLYLAVGKADLGIDPIALIEAADTTYGVGESQLKSIDIVTVTV